jgi:hypothetical protein
LTAVKQKAVENLTKYGVPVTLVCTVEAGINDRELGEIIEYGILTKSVRGINFQPVAYFGRMKSEAEVQAHVSANNRATLSGIINRIEEQTNGMLQKKDFIPLPCNVERVAITYLYRTGGAFMPITRNLGIEKYLPYINNTFFFNLEDILKENANTLINGSSFCRCIDFIKDIKNLVPLNFHLKSKKEKLAYVDENTFRISISSFLDAYNFDIKGMQKECVHVITPEGLKIPFSAYNMLHRKEREGCETNDTI